MQTIPRGHRMSPLNHDPEAVRWALTKSGYTQAQLADEVGVSRGLMSEILKGTRNARQPLLQQIARALNCPVVILESKRSEVA